MRPLFDTHCHLAGQDLKDKAAELAKAAFEGGIGGLALISADRKSLFDVGEIATQLRQGHPDKYIVTTAGIHPHDVEDIDEKLWEQVQILATQSAAAIGETGLDYYYDHAPRELQKKYFQAHIDLACECEKPLVIHCRQAADDVLKLLDRKDLREHPNPGILHCFTEIKDVAKRLLDLNFFISFSGILSFKNAASLREVASYVPLDRLLIETDSPYLAPVPHRGKQNQPLFVKDVFEVLVDQRAEDRDEIREQLWLNSCRVYQLDPNTLGAEL